MFWLRWKWMRRNAREHVSFPFRTILFFLSSTSTDEMKFEKRVSRFIICIYIHTWYLFNILDEVSSSRSFDSREIVTEARCLGIWKVDESRCSRLVKSFDSFDKIHGNFVRCERFHRSYEIDFNRNYLRTYARFRGNHEWINFNSGNIFQRFEI